ncbi:MAG TPA: ROK family protein [Candidatus Mediterraneibacter vanvlietii]|nr:ROK family protein [Candidatus Mediterraneibacter vanvlietii]
MLHDKLTLGSLFDGSGGFPLGGLLSGITPVWASEIEPFPIRVTTKRLPFMKHYGDVSRMDGAEVEPVDIITFGSPCQDMSIAGKRAGLGGSRSNLFYEAIRIVKEMRCATDGKYPRYIVWENVPGAFSSNKGADFHAVKAGDDVAKEIATTFGRYLGYGLANLAAVTDPAVFVIGGGVSKAGEVLIPYIREPYMERAFFANKNVRFVLAKLGNDAGICGAAKLVLDNA